MTTTGKALRRRLLACLLLVLLGLPHVWSVEAEARDRRFIRDAEIETIIRDFATPLFQAAGLNPSSVNVFLVDDPTLNAFVSGGQNLFLHTGFLIATEDPLEVIGVLAHETGHIAGGHIATTTDRFKETSAQVIASYVLGLGAALATGQPGLGNAIILGGQDLALKGLLSYTRSQEQAADQAAIRLLEATQQSPSGLLSFLRVLGGQEVFLATSQDPYLRTHPLTRERISFLEDQLRRSPYADTPPRPEFVRLHKRMRAKLIGFLQPQGRVLRAYPESDDSAESRYARAIMHYRRPELDRALALIDSLIAEAPEDAYYHELRGQILFENGRLAEALPSYEKAVRIRPDEAQLNLALARVEIETNDPGLIDRAEGHLKTALRQEPENASAWRLLAIVHGRRGETGLTALALAESALARRDLTEAQIQGGRAQELLPEGSPGWLRAQDLVNRAEQLRQRRQ